MGNTGVCVKAGLETQFGYMDLLWQNRVQVGVISIYLILYRESWHAFGIMQLSDQWFRGQQVTASEVIMNFYDL